MKTTEPAVKVEPVPVPPLPTGSVPVTPAPLVSTSPVPLVSVTDAGVPSAPPTKYAAPVPTSSESIARRLALDGGHKEVQGGGRRDLRRILDDLSGRAVVEGKCAVRRSTGQ